MQTGFSRHSLAEKLHLKATELPEVLAELGWLHEEPERVAALLTPDEARTIVKQGFVCGHLWADLQKRLKNIS